MQIVSPPGRVLAGVLTRKRHGLARLYAGLFTNRSVDRITAYMTDSRPAAIRW